MYGQFTQYRKKLPLQRIQAVLYGNHVFFGIASQKERDMHDALLLLGKALIVLGITAACISAGNTYSTRISQIAKGQHGQHTIRRAVVPMSFSDVRTEEAVRSEARL